MAKKIKTTDSSVQDKILEDVTKQLNKEIEDGIVTSYDQMREISSISTGNPSIDIALGIGGVPKGRIIEVFGPESSGKTTFALGVVAQAQKSELNKIAAYIDMEHAMDPSMASSMGVDFKHLLFIQPNTAEQALDIAYKLVERGDISVIVVDSVAALVPQAVVDKDSGQMTIGLIANLLTASLMKLNPVVSKKETTIIFINQLRDKIGTFGYGDKENTPGGRALKFYSSVRIDLRNIGKITKTGENATAEDAKDAIGIRVKVHIKKNKLAPPFKKAEVDLIFGRGFCYQADIFNIAVKNNIIKKGGSWFSFNDEKIGQGKQGALKTLKDNKDLFAKIETAVKILIKESSQTVIDEELVDEEDVLDSGVLNDINADDSGTDWKD